MRILILSLATGQGHNTAAAALAEEFCARGDECEVADAIGLSSAKASRAVAGAYIKMAVYTPRVFGGLYQAGLKISSRRHKSVVYLANKGYAEGLLKHIRQNGYDAVIAPHVFPADALTSLRREGNLSIPCFAVATDYTCVPFFEEAEMDAWFIPGRPLLSEFLKRGLPEEKLICTGIPVGRRCLEAPKREQAREIIEMDPDTRLALIMGGSMGFGNPQTLVRSLSEQMGKNSRVVVLCGRNAALKRRIEESFGGGERVMALGYTQEVPLWFAACDVLLTKPGGLTSTEAAVMGVPMVHTPPIPGCETKNASYFSSLGMSLTAKDTQTLAQEAAQLAADPERKAAMRTAQAKYMNPFAARDICDYIKKTVEGEKCGPRE